MFHGECFTLGQKYGWGCRGVVYIILDKKYKVRKKWAFTNRRCGIF